MTEMEQVEEALRHIRCSAVSTEMQLHEQAEKALRDSGMDVRHEVRLGAGARIDFVACGIGIEIKKSRPQKSKLLIQLARYAEYEEIRGLIVVAPRGTDLPKQICGKCVKVIALERLWGIGLP